MASEPVDDSAHEEVQTVTVRIFGNHEAAQLAAANLAAHGIECWVSADDCGGMYPNLTAASGVRLRVSATDAKAAEALLDTPASPAEINQIETEAAVSAPTATVLAGKAAWGQILSGIIIGILLCLLYQWNDKRGTKTYYEHTRNGKRSAAWVYRDGQPEKLFQDRNLDGSWDYWIYFKNGHMVRSEIDNNFDGKPDEFWMYADDLPVAQEVDTDFNGLTDEFSTFKYGTIEQLDIRPDESKFAVTREVFTNGVLFEIWRGGDSHGHFDEVVRYDSHFNPTNKSVPTIFPWPVK